MLVHFIATETGRVLWDILYNVYYLILLVFICYHQILLQYLLIMRPLVCFKILLCTSRNSIQNLQTFLCYFTVRVHTYISYYKVRCRIDTTYYSQQSVHEEECPHAEPHLRQVIHPWLQRVILPPVYVAARVLRQADYFCSYLTVGTSPITVPWPLTSRHIMWCGCRCWSQAPCPRQQRDTHQPIYVPIDRTPSILI